MYHWLESLVFCSLASFLVPMQRCKLSWFHTIFLLRKFNLGPILTGKKVSKTFFIFAKIFDCKVWKSHVCVVNNTLKHTFFVGYWHFHIFISLLLGVLTHLNTFSLPDRSFKIWEKPSKFSESVRIVLVRVCIVNDYVTWCLHSQRLHRHHVQVFND